MKAVKKNQSENNGEWMNVDLSSWQMCSKEFILAIGQCSKSNLIMAIISLPNQKCMKQVKKNQIYGNSGPPNLWGNATLDLCLAFFL